MKRTIGKLKPSLVAWAKRRRTQIDDMVKSAGVKVLRKDLKELKASDEGWTKGHQKESDHLTEKRMSRFVDALVDGHMDVNDLSREEVDVVLEELERRDISDKKSAAEARLSERAFAKAPKPCFNKQTIFVESDVKVQADCLLDSTRALGMRRVTDRTAADVFLVANIAEMSKRTAWCSCIRGGRPKTEMEPRPSLL